MVQVSEDFIGEVERVDNTVICTRFFFLSWMPVIPDDTFIEYIPPGATEPTRVKIPSHSKSVVAGYLSRGAYALGVLVGLGFVISFGFSDTILILLGLAAGACVTLAMKLLMARIARLSEQEKDQRRVYGAWLGPAVDPVLCGNELDPWVDRLRGIVAEQARGSEVGGYRSRPSGPRNDCAAALASRSVVHWGAAFTLVRAEMARTKDAGELRELARIHEELWGHIATKLSKTQKVRGFKRLQAAAPVPGKPVISRPSHRTAQFWGILMVGIGLAIVGGLCLAFFILETR